jgi:ribonuclease HI
MDNVDLYIYSTVKGMALKNGKHIYIIEKLTGKGPATLTGGAKEVKDVTGYQSELMAINEALKRMTKPCSIKVHAANVTLRAALQNGWYKTWADNDYRNSSGEEVVCADDWKEFNELIKEHCISDVVNDRHSYSSWMESECGK